MDAIFENIFIGHNWAADCPIFAKFCKKTQYPTTLTVECQKFRTSKIQDGGRICIETLQSVATSGSYRLVLSGRCMCYYQIKSNHLFESGDMAHTQALTHTHTIHNNTKEGKYKEAKINLHVH